MTNRYVQYSHSAWNQRALRHALVGSLVIHAMIVAGMAFALRTGGRENSDFVYQVRFIPKGVHDGAVNDPNAQAVVAEPPGGTAGEAPKPAAPEPAPSPPAPPKPKEPAPPKPKEPVPPKPKEPVPPKPKEAAPPKPKEKLVEKKPQERLAKADGTAKLDGKAAGKTDGQSPRGGVPGGTGTGGVIPQQGRPDGENVTGVAMQEEGLPHVLGYWIRLVQRNVELKWRMPEGVLIVPNQNSAMISFTVDRKGELIGEPEIMKEASDPEVAQSGIKAILEAAPFPKLPDEYAQNEQEVVSTFSVVK